MRGTHYLSLVVLAIAGFAAVIGGSACGENATKVETVSADITGTWRAVLESPGGELAFIIEVSDTESGPVAVIVNGEERLPFVETKVEGRNVAFAFPHYDSTLSGDVSEDGQLITGKWDRLAPGGERTHMVFRAERGVTDRFASSMADPADFSGGWTVMFSDEVGESLAQGEFSQQDDIVTGTFLTPVGDYRYLEGRVDGNEMHLSTFDGAHAFLFSARFQDDGSIEGDFWSRDTYHATWTAERGTADLGDAFELTRLTSEDGRFRFSFPNVDGDILSDDDMWFEGKALIINVFGTWCPNCNDEAPLLAELYEEYRERGLEIVSLANEFAPDFEGKAKMVRRFAERYGITWPILIVGAADKAETSERLQDVEKITSYPTTFFIGRDGVVKSIHTGFNGPGTGGHYDELVKEFRAKIEEILATPGQ